MDNFLRISKQLVGGNKVSSRPVLGNIFTKEGISYCTDAVVLIKDYNIGLSEGLTKVSPKATDGNYPEIQNILKGLEDGKRIEVLNNELKELLEFANFAVKCKVDKIIVKITKTTIGLSFETNKTTSSIQSSHAGSGDDGLEAYFDPKVLKIAFDFITKGSYTLGSTELFYSGHLRPLLLKNGTKEVALLPIKVS